MHACPEPGFAAKTAKESGSQQREGRIGTLQRGTQATRDYNILVLLPAAHSCSWNLVQNGSSAKYCSVSRTYSGYIKVSTCVVVFC